MITIINLGYKLGYSGKDHLLCDSDFTNLIGESFASMRALRKAVAREQDSDFYFVPVTVDIIIRNQAKTVII